MESVYNVIAKKKIYLYHLQKLPLTRHETRRTNNVTRSEIKYQVRQY